MSERRPILYGASYSVYVRSVALTLVAKGVKFEHVSVDIFGATIPPWYLALQPFARIPTFDDGGIILFETSAICRYIDETFQGERLQPTDPLARARMNQLISMADAYVYRPLVWDIYVEMVSNPREGKLTNQDVVRRALPKAFLFFEVMKSFMSGPWLLGDKPTLADFYLAPMLFYFFETEPGQRILIDNAKLRQWSEHVFGSSIWKSALNQLSL